MSDVRKKKCNACSEKAGRTVLKPLTDFHKRVASKDGVHTKCKVCMNAKQAERDVVKRAETTGIPIVPDAPAPPVEHVKSWQPFGTPLQRLSADAYVRAGSVAEAATALSMTPMLLRAHLAELEHRAARRGWLPGGPGSEPGESDPITLLQPAGFQIKGVSTLLGPDGEVKQRWVKTVTDAEDKYTKLLEAVATIAEPFKGMHEPTPEPLGGDSIQGYASADILNVIPMGDPHFGMFAWLNETDNNFDLKIAERDLYQAVDHVVALAPPADECLIIELGDFFHADNSSNQTSRSHHALDVDGRWPKVLSVGIRAMRRCIDRALEKHKRVRVIIEIGNHDDHSSIMLAICLANYYEREPRVFIDTSPAKFHWYRFGANLIGTTHGDTIKHDKLGQIMAADRARDWGETLYRYFYVGHVHHDSAKEVPGVIIETLRTLAARDAWHSGAGYRAGRDLKLDVLHREHGRIMRHTVGIPQLRSIHGIGAHE